jgi:predicted NAD/FAD-binding protein
MNSHIYSVSRTENGVTLRFEDGHQADFDKVVFAITPGHVFPLLADPSEAEKEQFEAWESSRVSVQIHTDTELYQRRGIRYFSEFDLFETEPEHFGYNAYLNRLSEIPEGCDSHFSLAFNLEQEIDPERVIHTQEHTTPLYSTGSWKHRSSIVRDNGSRHTFHVGAYLGDGLQEGAASSALVVSGMLGGKGLHVL